MKKLLILATMFTVASCRQESIEDWIDQECGKVIQKNGYNDGVLDIVMIRKSTGDTVHVVEKKCNQLYYDTSIEIGDYYCE